LFIKILIIIIIIIIIIKLLEAKLLTIFYLLIYSGVLVWDALNQ